MPDRRRVFVDGPVLAGLVGAVADSREVLPQRELELLREILDTTQGILIYLLEAHAIHNTSHKHETAESSYGCCARSMIPPCLRVGTS
ncbi:hypothetical protein D3C81_1752310 [compost metagenome]